MAIIKPPVKNIWADTGDKTEPTAGEVLSGWPLSSTPPSRQRFNWILNYCANAVRYFSRRGLVDYDAAETYSIGDKIIGDDGETYSSLQASNINHSPSSSPTWWKPWAQLKKYTFSVNKNGVNQAITGDVVTKLTFGTEDFDTDSVWNTGTSVFTCPVAGIYHFCLAWQPLVALGAIIVPIIYKNGAEVKRGGFYMNTAGGIPTSIVTTILNLAAGDTIEFYGILVTGNGGAHNVAGLATTTHAWGFKIT
jgi:hypothetical protein